MFIKPSKSKHVTSHPFFKSAMGLWAAYMSQLDFYFPICGMRRAELIPGP